MNTFWVTFYSYKGGVGRTMALANVAAILAKEGRRVLLIDFDLEAPGLDAFQDLGCCKGRPGVVEYATQYLATGKAPAISSFVHECTTTAAHLRGKLWLMPSGKKDEQYNHDRARIDWTELYDKFDGDKFVENWKADIAKTYAPDYVLVDSRTGLTEVGGICTLHLPQLVVLLFSLNDQNIHGIAGVARAISRSDHVRPPRLLTVVTPVPPMPKERTGLLRARMDLAEKEIGVRHQCQIHYDPFLSLKEQIRVWDDCGGLLDIEYHELRDKITDCDTRGLDFLIREVKRAIDELDEERALSAAADLERDFSDRAESFYHSALASRAFGQVKKLAPKLRKSLELDPYFEPAFDDLLALLKAKHRPKDAMIVCQDRLSRLSGTADSDVLESTLESLGLLSMAAGEYKAAAEAYRRMASTKIDSGEFDDWATLAQCLNAMEARRRSGMHVPKSEIKKLITLFEGGGATEGAASVVERMNRMQAMHVPYAMLGKLDQAVLLLKQVELLASTVSSRERIFSVATYTDLKLDDWLELNGRMIAALAAGKLWDGTPLR